MLERLVATFNRQQLLVVVFDEIGRILRLLLLDTSGLLAINLVARCAVQAFEAFHSLRQGVLQLDGHLAHQTS